MPKGVPVATVAIGNAANAGLLAARILATSDTSLLNKMLAYQVCPMDNRRCPCTIGGFAEVTDGNHGLKMQILTHIGLLQDDMRATVLSKADKLEKEGWE